ncbi:hypothetical protein PR048_019194, partial [Dryococelus australis]
MCFMTCCPSKRESSCLSETQSKTRPCPFVGWLCESGNCVWLVYGVLAHCYIRVGVDPGRGNTLRVTGFPPGTRRCPSSLNKTRNETLGWSSGGMEGRGKREFPEKTHRPAVHLGGRRALNEGDNYTDNMACPFFLMWAYPLSDWLLGTLEPCCEMFPIAWAGGWRVSYQALIGERSTTCQCHPWRPHATRKHELSPGECLVGNVVEPLHFRRHFTSPAVCLPPRSQSCIPPLLSEGEGGGRSDNSTHIPFRPLHVPAIPTAQFSRRSRTCRGRSNLSLACSALRTGKRARHSAQLALWLNLLAFACSRVPGLTSGEIFEGGVTGSYSSGNYSGYSPYTRANRVRFPVGVASCRAGFLRDFLFPSPLHSVAAPYSHCFTLIVSQDLDLILRRPWPSFRARHYARLFRMPKAITNATKELQRAFTYTVGCAECVRSIIHPPPPPHARVTVGRTSVFPPSCHSARLDGDLAASSAEKGLASDGGRPLAEPLPRSTRADATSPAIGDLRRREPLLPLSCPVALGKPRNHDKQDGGGQRVSKAALRQLFGALPSLPPSVESGYCGIFLASTYLSTKANRVQSPAGSLLDFRRWESCRTMPMVGGFSRGSPVSSALSFRCYSIFTSITLIGSQDLDVKSRPNLFTHSHVSSFVGGRRPHDTFLACDAILLACAAGVRGTCGFNVCIRKCRVFARCAKGDRDMRINSLIVSTCKALNWRAVLPSMTCPYETFGGDPTILLRSNRNNGFNARPYSFLNVLHRNALVTGLVSDWLLHATYGTVLAVLPASERGSQALIGERRAYTFPSSELDLILGGVAPGFSREGIVPDDAAGRRVFSGISRFTPPFHSGSAPYLASLSSAHKTSMNFQPHLQLKWGPRWSSGQTTRLPPTRTGFYFRRGRPQIFACENRARRCRPCAGFLGDLPFPSAFHSGETELFTVGTVYIVTETTTDRNT